MWNRRGRCKSGTGKVRPEEGERGVKLERASLRQHSDVHPVFCKRFGPVNQFSELTTLCHESIGAKSVALADVLFCTAGGIYHNRDSAELRVRLDPFQGLFTIHSGHVEVQQYDAGTWMRPTGACFKILDQLQSIGSEPNIGLDAGLGECALDEKLIFMVIVTDKDYRRAGHGLTFLHEPFSKLIIINRKLRYLSLFTIGGQFLIRTVCQGFNIPCKNVKGQHDPGVRRVSPQGTARACVGSSHGDPARAH